MTGGGAIKAPPPPMGLGLNSNENISKITKLSTENYGVYSIIRIDRWNRLYFFFLGGGGMG